MSLFKIFIIEKKNPPRPETLERQIIHNTLQCLSFTKLALLSIIVVAYSVYSMYILWLSFTALAAAVLVLDPSWSRCRRRLLIIDDDDPESKRKDRRRTSVVLRKSPGRVIIINIIILIKSRARKRATCCRCSHRFSHPRRRRERSFYITRARVYVYYSVIYHFRAIESKKANPKTIAAVLLHSDADSMR